MKFTFLRFLLSWHPLGFWRLGFFAFFFYIKSAYALVVEAQLRFSCEPEPSRDYDWMVLYQDDFVCGDVKESSFEILQCFCVFTWKPNNMRWWPMKDFFSMTWVSRRVYRMTPFWVNAMQYVIKLSLEASRRLEWLSMKTYFTPTYILGNCEQHNDFVQKALKYILSN